MTWRARPSRQLVLIACTAAPGLLALGWLLLGPLVRTALSECAPCAKAKAQARLEQLDERSAPILSALHQKLATHDMWGRHEWSIACDIVAGAYPCPPAEANAWPALYRIVASTGIARAQALAEPAGPPDGELALFEAALATGLRTALPACRVSLIVSLSGTRLAQGALIQSALRDLAAENIPLASRDARALLARAAPETLPRGAGTPAHP